MKFQITISRVAFKVMEDRNGDNAEKTLAKRAKSERKLISTDA